MSSLTEDQVRAIVKNELRKIIDAGLMYTVADNQPQQPKPASKGKSIDEVRQMFPEEIEDRLSFEEKGENIIITFKQFLGTETFAKIASVVRGMGGEYISAGKDSHFRVPKVR